MADLTPMMQQYMQIKEQNQDSILFFRLGDFYEMFDQDARIASKELDLTLTSRDKDKNKSAEEKIPMCGIPYHSAESYIARLVARGYKVSICEQTEDPALAKGLVQRDIIRVVTPGSVTESSMLDESRNNYFACVCGNGDRWGVSFCDVSTGAFYATAMAEQGAMEAAQNELTRFQPAEVLLLGDAAEPGPLRQGLEQREDCCVDLGNLRDYHLNDCRDTVEEQFGRTVTDLGMASAMEAVIAVGALLQTLCRVQKNDLSHIRELEFYQTGRFMILDASARRNLELTETLRSKEKRGSLLWVLDHTKTPMGSRLLRSWLEKPLLNPTMIDKRLSAVEELTRRTVAREELIAALRGVSDLERVTARIVTGSANARDLVALAAGCRPLPEIKSQLAGLEAGLSVTVCQALDTLDDLRERIDSTIVEEPPFTVREGGMICRGCNEELDRLWALQTDSKSILLRMETEEKEKTGIKNLRVGYNKVFGYYIEVAKGQIDLVPETYIRKQTLVNCERYITQELKELESTILNAKDRIAELEYQIFTALRLFLAEQAPRIQAAAQAVACADVLSCFAATAVHDHYCRPTVDLSDALDITDGRHPVVERMLKDTLFVPNDTHLDGKNCRAAIITGPNMAGKSTYMRQVALITLMAQIGSFVPARSARIGVVDRLFTRIGASDDLASGQSTFMVEMNEVADILHHATARSLLILDEIGRGTSTFDGMAIARAVLEYAIDPKKIGAKTLFATHYHELTTMADELEGLQNFNISVKKRQGDMIFLRKIIPGPAEASYGVEVAKLAGLPDKVVARARRLLEELESGAPARVVQTAPVEDQFSLADLGDRRIREKLEATSVETLTPIEAMNVLYELKKML